MVSTRYCLHSHSHLEKNGFLLVQVLRVTGYMPEVIATSPCSQPKADLAVRLPKDSSNEAFSPPHAYLRDDIREAD